MSDQVVSAFFGVRIIYNMKFDNPTCHACNYSLRGLGENATRCPECGETFLPEAATVGDNGPTKCEIRIKDLSRRLIAPSALLAIVLTVLTMLDINEWTMVLDLLFFGPALFLSMILVLPCLGIEPIAAIILPVITGVAAASQTRLYIKWLVNLFDRNPNRARWVLGGIVTVHLLCGLVAVIRMG